MTASHHITLHVHSDAVATVAQAPLHTHAPPYTGMSSSFDRRSANARAPRPMPGSTDSVACGVTLFDGDASRVAHKTLAVVTRIWFASVVQGCGPSNAVPAADVTSCPSTTPTPTPVLPLTPLRPVVPARSAVVDCFWDVENVKLPSGTLAEKSRVVSALLGACAAFGQVDARVAFSKSESADSLTALTQRGFELQLCEEGVESADKRLVTSVYESVVTAHGSGRLGEAVTTPRATTWMCLVVVTASPSFASTVSRLSACGAEVRQWIGVR